jgi:hypothetical protein
VFADRIVSIAKSRNGRAGLFGLSSGALATVADVAARNHHETLGWTCVIGAIVTAFASGVTSVSKESNGLNPTALSRTLK